MKYQVQIQYTNPSHEHVSLRRRVETVTRLVEAATEDEALNRAANQQRALGFRIQQATVIGEERKVTFGRSGGVMHHDSKTEKSEKDGTANLYDPEKHDKKLSPKGGFAVKKEEVEAVAEADVTKDLRTSMKMMDLRHGVDADKRDKGYKMSSTVRAAQKKFDAQSKGQGKMRPQAGTLAALKKEEAEPKELDGKKKVAKTSKKATKAAEKMIAAAKGKMNKINVQPTMEIDVKSK